MILPELTLDQIIERDGLRIWVKNIDVDPSPIPFKDEYAVVNAKLRTVESMRTIWRFDNYGTTWVAYGMNPNDRPYFSTPQRAEDLLTSCTKKKASRAIPASILDAYIGRPVWLVCDLPVEYTGWALFTAKTGDTNCFFALTIGNYMFDSSCYRKSWLVYDQKPDNNSPIIIDSSSYAPGQFCVVTGTHMIPPIVKFTSDYDPNTFLQLTRTEDGDIILRTHGNGELRFSASGGKLHGQELNNVLNAFGVIMNTIGQKQEQFYTIPRR